MSRETLEWLNRNTLVGFTAKRLKAWHHRADLQTPWEITMPDGKVLSGIGNHYDGPIPIEHVRARLFNWQAESRRVAVELPATMETMTHLSEDGAPMMWTVQDDRQAMAASDDNTVLGHFKSGYRAHQYDEWLLGNVATILDSDLAIGSAGLLKNRAIAWVQVEVPESITTPEGVEFRPNLIATTSFDGTVATTYKRTVTVVVCDNTRDMAMGEAGQMFKARHSKYSGMKIAAARDALNVIHTMGDDFANEVKALCETPVSDLQWSKLMDAVVPTVDPKGEPLSKLAITKAEAKRATLTGMWNNDNRCAPWTNTAYGVTQTFNTYWHHERPTRGKTNRAERNMEDAIKGGTGKFDSDVLKHLELILA